MGKHSKEPQSLRAIPPPMPIDKAIEILQDCLSYGYYRLDPDFTNALKLSVSALQAQLTAIIKGGLK